MKITKRQLKRIIKEEKAKVLKEQWGSRPETGSDLIEFAKAYAGLGDAVQSQFDEIVAAYNNSAPGSEEFMEVVYEERFKYYNINFVRCYCCNWFFNQVLI